MPYPLCMAGKSEEFFGNHRGDDYWLNGRTHWAQGVQEMARIFTDVRSNARPLAA